MSAPKGSDLVGKGEEDFPTGGDTVGCAGLERHLDAGLRVEEQLAVSEAVDTLADDGVAAVPVEGDHLQVEGAHGDLLVGDSVHGELFVVLGTGC